jgi:hypothetical protein
LERTERNADVAFIDPVLIDVMTIIADTPWSAFITESAKRLARNSFRHVSSDGPTQPPMIVSLPSGSTIRLNSDCEHLGLFLPSRPTCVLFDLRSNNRINMQESHLHCGGSIGRCSLQRIRLSGI